MTRCFFLLNKSIGPDHSSVLRRNRFWPDAASAARPNKCPPYRRGVREWPHKRKMLLYVQFWRLNAANGFQFRGRAEWQV